MIKLDICLGLSLLLIICGCSIKHRDDSIDVFFKEIEKQTIPQKTIQVFKTTPFDSAVLNYKKYPEIFYEGTSRVLEDTLQKKNIEAFFYKNNMSRYDPLNAYVFAGLFHYNLNGKNYENMDSFKNLIDRLVVNYTTKKESDTISTIELDVNE